MGMLSVAILAALAGPTRADLQTFDFSFTNVGGNVPGTVTGDIELSFSGDGTGSATSVTITGYPTGLNLVLLSPPIQIQDWDVLYNSFTVSDGIISYAQYYSIDNSIRAQFTLNVASENRLLVNGFEVADSQGLQGIVFTSVPVPEPSTLIIAGMAGACGLTYVVANKRRAARNTTNAE
jgi:hypothetical protein